MLQKLDLIQAVKLPVLTVQETSCMLRFSTLLFCVILTLSASVRWICVGMVAHWVGFNRSVSVSLLFATLG